jgi:hypothetical protein
MHIPVYFKSDEPLPELALNEIRYVVADNGTFLERRTEMFATCTRINRLDLDLRAQDQFCVLHCGRLPRTMHRAMLSFFEAAHGAHGGEAALVLLYHPQRRSFRWHCPVQTIEMVRSLNGWVALDTIQFDNPLELPDGFLHFGDAHLHPGSPHPSALDIADDQDGLHVIVGNIDKTPPDYNIDFVVDGVRFAVRPEHVFEDPCSLPFGQPPDHWMSQIRVRRIPPLTWGGGNGSSREGDTYQSDSNYYGHHHYGSHGSGDGGWYRPHSPDNRRPDDPGPPGYFRDQGTEA